MKIDNYEQAEAAGTRIAFVSSRNDGRDRWTELEVIYLPMADAGERFVAFAIGCSNRPGEVDRPRHVQGQLETVLEIYEDNPLGRQVKAEARAWVERLGKAPPSCVSTTGALARPDAGAVQPFTGKTDEEALAWLFGENATLVETARRLGMEGKASTIRMQLKKGQPVRVPLAFVAQFIDRAALLTATGGTDETA